MPSCRNGKDSEDRQDQGLGSLKIVHKRILRGLMIQMSDLRSCRNLFVLPERILVQWVMLGAIVTIMWILQNVLSVCKHGGKGRHLREGVNSRMDTIQAAN